MSAERFCNILNEALLGLAQRDRNLQAYEEEVKDLKQNWEQERNVDPELATQRAERLVRANAYILHEKTSIEQRFQQLVVFGQIWNRRE